MNESDATLARRANQDAVAMATLLGRHQSLVFRVCMRLLGHRQDAEDMTQETLARVAKYFDRFDPGRPLEPWLISIAGNRCRSLLTRRSKWRSVSIVTDPACDKARLEQDAGALREEVMLALTRLPDNHRRAFELFHVDTCGYTEIAERLGCPIGTAKTWVHRARAGLIDQLRDREVINESSQLVETRGPS